MKRGWIDLLCSVTEGSMRMKDDFFIVFYSCQLLQNKKIFNISQEVLREGVLT